MKEKVLITGGTGFIGYYIAEQLIQNGYGVVLYDIARTQGEVAWLYSRLPEQVEFIKGDIGDLASLLNAVKESGISSVVHAAALTDVEILEKSPLTSLRINGIGSINVMEAARLMDLRRVVMTSSIAVYAPKQYEPIDERHPVLLPDAGPALSTYTSSKLTAELFGLHYWQQYKTSIVAVRFSGVYGFGMRYPLYIKPMLENSLAGVPTRIESGGDAKRDFVYAKDVAQGVFKALTTDEKNLRQRIYNIAHGGPLKNVFDLADAVREIVKDADIYVGGGMTEYEARIDKSRGEYDITKAVEQLAYSPCYDLKAGIKEYTDLFKSYIKHTGEMKG